MGRFFVNCVAHLDPRSMIRLVILFIFLISPGVNAETISASSDPATATGQCRAYGGGLQAGTGKTADYCWSVYWANKTYATWYKVCDGSFSSGPNNNVMVSGNYRQTDCSGAIYNTFTGEILFNATPSYSCPTGQGWTLSGSSCSRPDCVVPEIRNESTGACELPPCLEGQHREGTECVSDCASVSGTKTGSVTLVNPLVSRCASNNCKAFWSTTFGVGKLVDGVHTMYSTGYFTFADSYCTGNDPDPADTPAPSGDSCGSGQTLITRVDGYSSCASNVDGSEQSSNVPTSIDQWYETTDPVSGNKTVEKTTTHADGSVTKQSTTYSSTGVPISSVISGVGASAGSSGGTVGGAGSGGGDEETMSEFCAANPTAGACVAQGAIEAEGEFATQVRNYSVNALFGSRAGSCPADKVFTVSGQSFIMPTGMMCDFAGWLRPLILALAWFSAAGITAGAIRGDN